MQREQEELEPVFIDNSVDLVLTAHEHEYSRMCAMKGGVCDETGPTYVVDGTAGAYTNNADTGEGYNCTLPTGPFTEPVVAEDCMWGWSTLEATATELKWRHMRWLTGETGDEATLVK